MQTLARPTHEEMYKALIEKNPQFEGIFFAAIQTTGIFCRPTCHARKPKKENVEYFPTAKDALDNGYRPCKVCHPLEYSGNAPGWIIDLLQEIDAHPGTRINDTDLRIRGLDPARVRRWFKKYHGITFQSYLRSLRINIAFDNIKQGKNVTGVAFKNGYDSLSGFGETFKNNLGFPPSQSKSNELIVVSRLKTPLGPMLAGATTKGICLLEFTDRRMLETQLERIKKIFRCQIVSGKSDYFKDVESQLQEYFDGKRKQFSVPLELNGTPFQVQVWEELLQIPYGETRSYKQQATAIGNPRAIRAVGRANGDNRIAIIVPCHRVVGADGSLTGYGGGLHRKNYLLNLENANR